MRSKSKHFQNKFMNGIVYALHDIKSLHNQIINNLNLGEPFSHIRLGEGEGKLLYLKYNNNCVKSHFINHYGHIITTDQYDAIVKNLVKSILTSNSIGCSMGKYMKHFNVKKVDVSKLKCDGSNAHKLQAFNCTQHFLPIMFLNSLEKSHSELLSKKLYTSQFSHEELLSNKKNGIDNILKSVDRLTIVSGRNVVSGIKSKYPNIKEVEFYEMIPQSRFSKHKYKFNDFMSRANEIAFKLRNSDRSGQLLLFGAGFFKLFGPVFAEAGGVAVDMGSVFDTWAGIKTRYNMNQNYMKKYKL